MTHSQQIKLKPAIRLYATVSLFVWLVAVTFCSAECFIGDSHCQACHDERTASSHHESDQTPGSDKHEGRNDSFCESLKSVAQPAHSSVLSKPDFGLVFIQKFVTPSQALIIAEFKSLIFRQPSDRDWLLTPELCLGPAFRSLAPPVLS